MLDDTQLKAIWARYGKHTQSEEHRAGFDAWWGAYRKHVSAVQAASPSDLSSPTWQERLWTDKSITPVGPGDSINVKALYADTQVVEAIVTLESTRWPAPPQERARAIQRAFDELLDLVATKDVRMRPAAKLKRIFAALLPRELTCVMSYGANQDAASLILPDRGHGHLGLHVLMRQRLRDVLGPEQNLDDDIERSCFCWWLHENHAALSDPSSVSSLFTNDVGGQIDLPSLELWPFGKQYKAVAAITGLDDTYRAIIQNSQSRVSRDDLVEMLAAEDGFETLQPKSIRQIITGVKGLGFLEERGGLLAPTRAGEELLEDDQADILVEALLQRVYGYAQLLRRLEEAPSGLSFINLAGQLRTEYRNWTTDRPVRGMLRWARAVGLVEQTEDKNLVLSDYGRGWASRLPPQLPAPPRADAAQKWEIESEVEAEVGSTPAAPAAPFPAFELIFTQMKTHPDTKGFVFDRVQVAALDAAWRLNERKRFAILSGLSGTGKTAVVRCYAHAVCAQMGIDPKRHLATVPVSPDWRDPSAMLGYFNALHADPTFHVEPTLWLLLQASRDPARPYFLLLDEMNLARVERYFAPMLSAMETGDALSLHANPGPINGVPPSIAWPHNLYIAGTVNMDESTHPFSDKVLDRAFTLEFWDVDLPRFFGLRAQEGRARQPETEAILERLHACLVPIRRHFGYRTAGEVLDFIDAMQGAAEEALDLAVFAKVLPRLRGEETAAMTTALEGVVKVCMDKGLAKSEAKVHSMLDQLQHTGVTKFWA